MRPLALCFFAALLLAPSACKKGGDSSSRQDETNPKTQQDDARQVEAAADAGDRSSPMPNTADEWKEAEALAKAHAKQAVEKRTDELPFVFMVSGQRSVLVHNGAVVTDKGPQVAADYLRDIGIVAGPGPSIESVLHVLWLLEAGPQLEGLKEEGYVLSQSAKMKDLTAQVQRADGSAQIRLAWFVDTHKRSGATAGPRTRDVLRAMLTITAEPGAAEWKTEEIEWVRPPRGG
jgi:hypothetical protein